MSKQDSRIIKVIVIGASAGGIRALLKILRPLPKDFRLPIVMLLHLPEHRESKLAEVFQHHLAMTVRQAEDKESIKPGTIYVAGPGCHLSIEHDQRFSLSGEEPVNYARPSIDILMQSAADAYGNALAGILLTGANHDGAQGLASINDAGGLTVVQDPEEAEIAIMPCAAINLRQPDFILSLTDIYALIVDLEKNK